MVSVKVLKRYFIPRPVFYLNEAGDYRLKFKPWLQFTFVHRMKLPARWSEMTRKQGIMFLRLLCTPGFGMPDIENYSQRFQIRMLQYLMRDQRNLIGNRYFNEEDFFALGDLQIHILLRKVNRLYTDQIYPSLYRFYSDKYFYFLPKKNMEDCSFIEFSMAEEYYRNICDGNDVENNLVHLVAVLCKRKRNEKYDELKVRCAAESFKNDLCWEFKSFVLLFFRSVRKGLIDTYPNIFKKSNDKNPKVGRLEKYRLIGTLHFLAKERPFGTWEQTAHSNMHLVLNYLNYHQDFILDQQEFIEKKNYGA